MLKTTKRASLRGVQRRSNPWIAVVSLGPRNDGWGVARA